MELYPAIDIRAGRVVRVRRGDPGSEIVYHPDPRAVAAAYARDGARWIHVVDLDRVFGAGDQTALIADLVRRAPPPLRWQAGGGSATAEDVEALLACGVARVVVRAGAGALPELARRCGGSRLAVALDVAAADPPAGRAAHALGRAEAATLARAAKAAGIGTVVYTDLGLEGRLSGADLDGAAALATTAQVDVVVSGGIHSLEELSAIRAAGLAGAVVGRALYEKRFTLPEALACSSR